MANNETKRFFFKFNSGHRPISRVNLNLSKNKWISKIVLVFRFLLFVFFFFFPKADVTGRFEFSRRNNNIFRELKRESSWDLVFLLEPQNTYMPRYSVVIRVMETGAVRLAPSPEW
jgi:hypothetical protein